MKNFLIQFLVFLLIFAAHFGLTSIGFYNSFGKFETLTISKYYKSYLESLKNYSGMSLGLIGFFITYAILRYKIYRSFKLIRSGIITMLVLLTGLYLSFGIHCSTSMYDYWTNKMGSFYFKVQLLFLFVFTLISIAAGMIIIWRKSKKYKMHIM